MNDINTICVCGAGTMGSGIAQAAASSGFFTILYELNDAVLESAEKQITKNLLQLEAKGKITLLQREETQAKLLYTNDLFQCIGDVIIEAIVEKKETKVSLFNQLAEINHSETVFATNTSSLSVDEIASGIKNPARVVGMHFFNPPTIMKLVEIVKGTHSNEQSIEVVTQLAKKMGKITVACIDSPGFIVNRVARPYYIEALRLIEAGVADAETIDTIMESRGFRMGPFKLMDLIGNDINYAVSCSVYDQMGRPDRLKPSEIQKTLVEQGYLGKKTGKGYYDYPQK